MFKKLREEKGLTKSELSSLFKVSNATLSQYENNNREPDNKMLSKLADYFKVSTDYLLGRSNIRNPYEPKV